MKRGAQSVPKRAGDAPNNDAERPGRTSRPDAPTRDRHDVAGSRIPALTELRRGRGLARAGVKSTGVFSACSRARGSVARQIDRENTNDRVGVALGPATVFVVELVVDPASAADLVVEDSREPFRLTRTLRSTQVAGVADQSRLARTQRNIATAVYC